MYFPWSGLMAYFFLALNNNPLCAPQFIYPSPTKGLLCCFQVLAVMNKHPCAGFCVDIGFQLLWVHNKEHDHWMYDKSIVSFVRKYQTVFQSGLTILHSHQQWMRFPVALHPSQHLVLSIFWILAILIDG